MEKLREVKPYQTVKIESTGTMKVSTVRPIEHLIESLTQSDHKRVLILT